MAPLHGRPVPELSDCIASEPQHPRSCTGVYNHLRKSAAKLEYELPRDGVVNASLRALPVPYLTPCTAPASVWRCCCRLPWPSGAAARRRNSSPRTSRGVRTRSGPVSPPASCARATFVAVRDSLGGPSVCGALRPFSVAAAAQGSVQLRPAALLRCPMVPAVDRWVERVVHPGGALSSGRPRGRAQGGRLLFLPADE